MSATAPGEPYADVQARPAMPLVRIVPNARSIHALFRPDRGDCGHVPPERPEASTEREVI